MNFQRSVLFKQFVSQKLTVEINLGFLFKRKKRFECDILFQNTLRVGMNVAYWNGNLLLNHKYL